MNIFKIGQYRLIYPAPSGGKAGKGRNKTSSLQLISGKGFRVKSFRYDVRSPESKRKAIEKGKAFALSAIMNPEIIPDYLRL